MGRWIQSLKDTSIGTSEQERLPLAAYHLATIISWDSEGIEWNARGSTAKRRAQRLTWAAALIRAERKDMRHRLDEPDRRQPAPDKPSVEQALFLVSSVLVRRHGHIDIPEIDVLYLRAAEANLRALWEQDHPKDSG